MADLRQLRCGLLVFGTRPARRRTGENWTKELLWP